MTPEELIQEAERVFLQINQQLENRKNGISGPGTLSELNLMSQEFKDLLENLKQNKIPPKGRRWLSSARIVTDTWDLKEPLGDDICMVSHLYRSVLE